MTLPDPDAWIYIVDDTKVSPALGSAYMREDRGAFLSALERSIETTPSGCWEWRGERDENGYAYMYLRSSSSARKQRVGLHRIALEVDTGMKLGRRAAHHRCANPPCVNPQHLVAVTAAENTAEMNARRAFIQRIHDLESALTNCDPGNPLLGQLPYGTEQEVAAYRAAMATSTDSDPSI